MFWNKIEDDLSCKIGGEKKLLDAPFSAEVQGEKC